MSTLTNQSTGDRNELVEIESITRTDTQLRVKMDPQAVTDYAEQYRNKKECQMPPIVIFEDAEADVWHLGDGYHRCEAALAAGRKNIDAIIKQGTLDDAILYAAKCNSHNAVRWSRKDMIKAIRTLRNRFPKLTQRDICKQCGCSQGFVSNVLSGKAEQNSDTESTQSVRKTVAAKFVDAIEKAERFFNELVDCGDIKLTGNGATVPQDLVPHVGRIVVLAEALGMHRPSPANDHDDQPSDEVVEAEVVQQLPESTAPLEVELSKDLPEPTDDPSEAIAGVLDEAIKNGKSLKQLEAIVLSAFQQQVNDEPITSARRVKRKIRELLPSPLSSDRAGVIAESVLSRINGGVA